jgi:hypothetical protein
MRSALGRLFRAVSLDMSSLFAIVALHVSLEGMRRDAVSGKG